MKNIKNRTIRLIASILMILIITWIASFKFLRFDLTSEGRYTLSDYTVEKLENLEDLIYIKVYLEGKDLPINYKKMRRSVKEQLEEFKVYSGSNIEFEFINPSESTDKEIRFGLYKQLIDKNGLYPIETKEVSDEGKTSVKMVFPGAVISYKGIDIGVNLLKNTSGVSQDSEVNINNSIQSLEYELINAIQKLIKKNKPEIAFIEGQGEIKEQNLSSIIRVLQEYYLVKFGEINGRPGVLDQFKAIIIAKPQSSFTEQDKFVIDQYIMNGGNVLWLVEGTTTSLDSLYSTSETMVMGHDVNLNDMLFNYGARVNHNMLQDKQSSPIGLTVKGTDGEPRIKLYPWYYFPVLASDNNHVISKYVDYIKTEFVCTVDTVGEDSDIKKTVLLKSSDYSKLVQIPAYISLRQIHNMPDDILMDAGRKNVAVLLEGKFKSVFKNRQAKKYFPDKPDLTIKETGESAKMVIVGDGDIIKNEISQDGKPYPLGFDKFSKQIFNGNKEFILNSVNYLCDDGGLMSIRSREIKMRLLEKDKIRNNRLLIQILNVVLPIIFIIIFAFIVYFVRKRKYSKV